jgi:hypothetical protein
MKYLNVILVLTILCTACKLEKDYSPDDQLTAQQKDAIMTSIIRYLAKSPDGVSGEERFNSKYNEYYMKKMEQSRFEKYAAKGDDYFFQVSQPAPSMIEKRHATGGRFKLNDKGELTEYEEIFRTWKMVPDTLKKRSSLLFDKMVKGESLAPYLTKNTNVEYIEFPDDRTFYDKATRTWRTKE